MHDQVGACTQPALLPPRACFITNSMMMAWFLGDHWVQDSHRRRQSPCWGEHRVKASFRPSVSPGPARVLAARLQSSNSAQDGHPTQLALCVPYLALSCYWGSHNWGPQRSLAPGCRQWGWGPGHLKVMALLSAASGHRPLGDPGHMWGSSLSTGCKRRMADLRPSLWQLIVSRGWAVSLGDSSDLYGPRHSIGREARGGNRGGCRGIAPKVVGALSVECLLGNSVGAS